MCRSLPRATGEDTARQQNRFQRSVARFQPFFPLAFRQSGVKSDRPSDPPSLSPLVDLMGGKDISPYGEKSQYDPSFRGPTESRSCTDVICTIIFILFLAGYFVVGILAWVYGDPRQLLYPRNSTGSYCGVGENLDKPNLLYFNIIKCAAGVKNPLTVAMKGLQCPTTQICVSNCSDKFWVVPLAAFLPGVMPFTVWNQRFCQPKIDLMTTTLTVPEILSQQLCPEFTIPTVSTINRCFPSFDTFDAANFNVNGMTQNETLGSIIQGTQQLVASFSLRDIGLKIFEDLSRSWHWILIIAFQVDGDEPTGAVRSVPVSGGREGSGGSTPGSTRLETEPRRGGEMPESKNRITSKEKTGRGGGWTGRDKGPIARVEVRDARGPSSESKNDPIGGNRSRTTSEGVLDSRCGNVVSGKQLTCSQSTEKACKLKPAAWEGVRGG